MKDKLKRDNILSVAINSYEEHMLDELSEANTRTKSEVVRELIRTAWRQAVVDGRIKEDVS